MKEEGEEKGEGGRDERRRKREREMEGKRLMIKKLNYNVAPLAVASLTHMLGQECEEGSEVCTIALGLQACFLLT